MNFPTPTPAPPAFECDVLGGGLYGKTPIWRAVRAWKQRRINIRDVEVSAS
jgi:hypothetical protein